MRWYDSVQNANGASDLASGAGFTGFFQLVSPFGPIPGYSGIDPFDGTILGFEDPSGTFTLTEQPNSFPSGDVDTSNTPPNIFGPLSVPEPSSVVLLASGCVGALAFARRIRRRSAA